MQGNALVVYLNVSVLAFPFIDTFNLKITADFFLNLRWYDLRIEYRDLNNITSLNSLSDEDLMQVWSPKLSFVNALGPYQTMVDKFTSGHLVRQDKFPLAEDYTMATEGIYSGFCTFLNHCIFKSRCLFHIS